MYGTILSVEMWYLIYWILHVENVGGSCTQKSAFAGDMAV
jgi:hypothetical protein